MIFNNNIQFWDGASKEHYTLCRCGASSNKLFCDDMHKVINLKDGKKTVASDIPQDRITILLLQFMPSGGSLNYILTYFINHEA